MTLWLLPDLVAAILNFSFGVYVYLKSQKKLLHYLFVLFILNLVMLQLSECQLLMARSPSDAFFWIKIEYVAIFFFPAILVHFSLVFASKEERSLYRYTLVYIPTILLIAIMLFTDLIFTGVLSRPWGYGSVKGPFHITYRIYYAVYTILAIGVLAASIWKISSPIKRTQGKYFLVGLPLPLVFGVVILNILQPLDIHNLDVLVTPLATIPMTGIFAYAIVKHRLMDIDVVITKTAASMVAFFFWLIPLWVA